MHDDRRGQTAVIFLSERTGHDAAGYATAAEAMAALAAVQPGYCGVDSVRGGDGVGITVSYWADDAAAVAWRDQPEHAAIRNAGRDRWYRSYTMTIATVTRGYGWTRA